MLMMLLFPDHRSRLRVRRLPNCNGGRTARRWMPVVLLVICWMIDACLGLHFNALFRRIHHQRDPGVIVPWCGISEAMPNYRQPRVPATASNPVYPINPKAKRGRGKTNGNLWASSATAAASNHFHQPQSFNNRDRGRIIRGHGAKKKAWPWQVSVQLELKLVGRIGHWCGGVLVHPRWILTAAHCIKNDKIENLGAVWSVVVNDHDREFLGNDRELVLPIEEAIVHPDFVEYSNDIALLHLPPDRRLRRIAPACLPFTEELSHEDFLGIRCFATGWGQTDIGGELQDQLRQAEMRVVDNETCAKRYAKRYSKIQIVKEHLCAGGEDKGTCVGDSGGPLHCNMRDGRWYLAGITSFGSGCAKPGFPDVFTRVNSYTDWITDVIEKYAKNYTSEALS